MRLAYIVGLAALAAMSANGEPVRLMRADEEPEPRKKPKKPKMRQYPAPIGPPQPMSRQHRRAMERAAAKATPTPSRTAR